LRINTIFRKIAGIALLPVEGEVFLMENAIKGPRVLVFKG
jgi:hypothetical protein